jgi:uncharacterized protein
MGPESTSASGRGWNRVVFFVIATYAITWTAWFFLRQPAAAGHLSALFTFIFVTVWSPTVIAIVIALAFDDPSGLGRLLRLLFRALAKQKIWYIIALVVPGAAVAVAILATRFFGQAAPFVPLSAFPITVAIQLATGAVGEELGWRGFLLSELQSKLSRRTSAIVMGILWSLWHLPAFFLPGMPQTLVPPAAFLVAVFSFAIFLALLFNRTLGHVLCTMLAHFSFNLSLAVGGARFGATLWWTLAALFFGIALWSLAVLPRELNHG